jgi:hypothetical protein
MALKNTIYTHRHLLRDLSEIKAILDVESQLIHELVMLARSRRTAGFELLF